MKNIGKKAVFTQDELLRAKEYVGELDMGSKGVGGLVVLLMNELRLTGDRVASLLGISGSSVDRVLSKFRACKLSVGRNPGGGRNHSRMSPDKEAEFLEAFREKAQTGEIITVDAFISALEGRFNCEIKKDYVYKMLKRNGWRKVSPDKAHPRNDKEKMEEFKKKTLPGAILLGASVARLTGGKFRLFYQDEARFGRLPVIERAWSPKGMRPVVKAAVVREYKYAYGAIDVLNGDVFCRTYDMMNTEYMEDFISWLRKEYPNDYIVLVVDGASSHTTEKLKLPVGMYIQVLPPYCPELNPVEQLWKHLRSHACGNRYFDTLNKVTETVEHEVSKLAKDRELVKQMFYWKSIQEAHEMALKILEDVSKAS